MNIFRLIGQHTHPLIHPHAHERVSLQATSRISRRYSYCYRKYRQRAHVEVRLLVPRAFWNTLTIWTRYLLQDPGFVRCGVRHSLPRPTMELGFVLQLRHEAVLHWELLLYPLSHESQVPVRHSLTR